MAKRILIIGLDGATFDIIHPLVKQGRLPHIYRLMNSGNSCNLTSTVPPITPPAWVSFMTGKNPAKHGIFDFIHHSIEGPGDDLRFVSYNSIATNTLWDIFTEKDKRMILINIPITYPPPSVNGIVISGLMTPNDSSNFVSPPHLTEEIMGRGYRVDFHPLTDTRSRDQSEWIKEYFDIEEKRRETTINLLKNHDWDFSMVVFGITDRIQHLFWGKENGSLWIQKAYELVDGIIGDLLTQIDDQTFVFIVSDHGFGPVEKVFFTNRWLLERGLLSLKKTRLREWKDIYEFTLRPIPLGSILCKIRLGIINNILPKTVASHSIKIPLIRRKISPSVVDWGKTMAYGDSFGIYINLKDREKQGIVEPGDDYEKIREQIVSSLYDLRDPETGEKVVDIVIKREDIYSGPFLKTAPDVIFQIKGLSYISNRSFYFRKLFMTQKSGNHRMEGIFIASGPGISNKSIVKDARIIDLAPTILYAMGLAVQDDMDGRVLEEIFGEEYRLKNPLKYEAAINYQGIAEYEVYNSSDIQMIKESLMALGYLT